MRIALLSDIHANLVALNTVLDDLDRERIDQLVFLGDAAVFGPQPREVLAVLRNLNCLSIMGNTDDWLLNQTPGNSTDEDSRHLADIYFWCAEQLSSADFEFVRTFKPTAEIVLSDNTTLLCFHGSPSSCRQAILPTTPDEEFQSMLSGQIATVMVGGHTHVQIFRRHIDLCFINPGSVGLPIIKEQHRVRRPPWAEYALAEWGNNRYSLEFRRVPIDVDQLIRAAHDSGMPHAGWWSNVWG